jgi:hypothetical protein
VHCLSGRRSTRTGRKARRSGSRGACGSRRAPTGCNDRGRRILPRAFVVRRTRTASFTVAGHCEATTARLRHIACIEYRPAYPATPRDRGPCRRARGPSARSPAAAPGEVSLWADPLREHEIRRVLNRTQRSTSDWGIDLNRRHGRARGKRPRGGNLSAFVSRVVLRAAEHLAFVVRPRASIRPGLPTTWHAELRMVSPKTDRCADNHRIQRRITALAARPPWD